MAVFKSVLMIAVLGGFYAWVVFKARTPPPVVIHCLFIGALVLSVLRLLGRLLPPRPEPKPVPGPLVRSIHDDVLGPMELREVEGNLWWRISPGAGPFDFTVEIVDEEAPDPGIVQHVRELAARLPEFKRELQQFLEDEARKQPKFREEILSLKIESLAFLWEKKPTYGEIQFSEPPSGQFWTCAYTAGKLTNLGVET
jgi:hypothetical protein